MLRSGTQGRALPPLGNPAAVIRRHLSGRAPPRLRHGPRGQMHQAHLTGRQAASRPDSARHT